MARSSLMDTSGAKMNLTENDLTLIRIAIKQGLDELTALESRLYPRALEVDGIRGAFYALQQKFPRETVRLPLRLYMHPTACKSVSECNRLEFHI